MTYFGAELGDAARSRRSLAEFEAESGNTVNFVDVGHEDFKTGILVQLAGGNPPDVHTDWAGARTAFQAQNGLLAPIDEMWAANDLDSQFGAGMIESAVTYDGVKYLLPFGFHIAPMWYNPKVFADNGVEIPATWDDLKAACETFSDAGITAHLDGCGQQVAGPVLVRLPHPAHGWRRVPRRADGRRGLLYRSGGRPCHGAVEGAHRRRLLPRRSHRPTASTGPTPPTSWSQR